MSDERHRNATLAVHAGERGAAGTRSIVTPTFATSTFRFGSMAEVMDHVEGRALTDDYARYTNPTVRAAERKIAALEGAEDAVLVASGMAALSTTFLTLLAPGQHVVLAGDCYRPTEQFLTQTLSRFGIDATVAAPDDPASISASIEPGRTRALFLESPSNPRQFVADLEVLALEKKRARGLKIVVDATLASPVNDRPLEHGADLVIQSATKYLGGHNDLLAGVVSGREGMVSAIRDTRGQLGAITDPHVASLLLRGLKTLPLRMAQHNASALAVARALEAHPKVERVYYAGLESHPSHAVAAGRMSGFGGVVSFELRSDLEGVFRFCDAVRVFQIGASFGGAESLLHPPAVFSYWDMDPADRAARGISDSLIRLGVGLEDAEDLVADVLRALDAV